MSIETSTTTEPVKGEIATRVNLTSFRDQGDVTQTRDYAAITETVDEEFSAFTVVKSERGNYSLRVLTSDLRDLAAVLVAHSDALGLPAITEETEARR